MTNPFIDSPFRLTIRPKNQNEPVPQNVTDVIVEEGETKIKAEIFESHDQLKSIILPLQAILIPKYVTTLERSVFYYCQNLESVMVQKGSQLHAIPRQ